MPRGGKSKGFEDVASAIQSGKKILRTVSKAAQLAKGAKGIYSRAKEAAGKSKCDGKQCSWKEKLQDFAERAIRGGKSVFAEKEKIKSMVEEGKRLVSGDSSRSKSKKMMSEQPKKMIKEQSKQMEKSVPVPPPAPSAMVKKASNNDLMAEIRKGKALKKSSMNEKKKAMGEDDIYAELRRKMMQRRKGIGEDE